MSITIRLECDISQCSKIREGGFYSRYQLNIPDCYCGCLRSSEKDEVWARYRVMIIHGKQLPQADDIEPDQRYILTAVKNTKLLGIGNEQESTFRTYSPEEFKRLKAISLELDSELTEMGL